VIARILLELTAQARRSDEFAEFFRLISTCPIGVGMSTEPLGTLFNFLFQLRAGGRRVQVVCLGHPRSVIGEPRRQLGTVKSAVDRTWFSSSVSSTVFQPAARV